MDSRIRTRLSVAGRLSLRRGLVSSAVVMRQLGYKSRAAFLQFVRRFGLPHIRLNARRIMFEPDAVNDWLSHRSSNGVVTLGFDHDEAA